MLKQQMHLKLITKLVYIYIMAYSVGPLSHGPVIHEFAPRKMLGFQFFYTMDHTDLDMASQMQETAVILAFRMSVIDMLITVAD